MERTEQMEVARRLRQEHTLLREITVSLTAVAESMSKANREDWLARIKQRFEDFRTHMNKRIELEEVGGFMSTVEEVRPTLAPQVEHLKDEHTKITGMIEKLHGELGQLDAKDEERLCDCVLRLKMLLSEVRQHENRESIMLGFVFTQDIGSAD